MKMIGGLFGRNAFGPLYEHLVQVGECVELLMPMMERFVKGEFDEIEQLSRLVTEREGKADNIKSEIRRQLSTSIFSAVDRADFLNILSVQDKIADRCEEIGKLLEIRRTPCPKALKEPVLALSTMCAKIYGELQALSANIIELSEHPTPKKQLPAFLKRTEKINHGTFEASGLAKKYLKKLFRVENELDPISVLFHTKLVELLESHAKACENTADVFNRLLSNRF